MIRSSAFLFLGVLASCPARPAPKTRLAAALTAADTTVLYQTDFSSGAPGWTVPLGIWTLATDSGNALYRNTNVTGDAWAVYGDTSWRDYAVQARVRLTAVTAPGVVRLFARYQNLTNWYYVNLRSSGTVELRKYVNRTVTDLAPAKAYPVTVGTWYTLRLEVQGTAVRAFVNGVLQLSATDTSFRAGPMALGTYNATADFDDVLVQSLAPVIAPPPPPPPPPPPTSVVRLVVWLTPLQVASDSGTGPFLVAAVPKDSAFAILATGLTWTSSDTSVARVVADVAPGISQVATVYLRHPGVTTITASAGGQSAATTFTVLSPKPQPLSVRINARGFRVENVPSRWEGMLPSVLPLYTTAPDAAPYTVTLFGLAYDTLSVVGHARCTIWAGP